MSNPLSDSPKGVINDTHFSLPGVSLLRQLSIGKKSILLALLSIIPLLLLSAYGVSQSSATAMQDRQRATQERVEAAHSILRWAHEQTTTGKLSEEEAQRLAIDSIGSMRFGESGYFWIIDRDMTLVMQPVRPSMVGTSGRDIQDPDGVYIFREFVNVARGDNAGFVAHLWPKPGQETPVEKLNYAQGFSPWDWIIGSGVYVDDIEAQTSAVLVKTMAIGAVIVAISAYVFICFVQSLQQGLRTISRHLNEVANGNLTHKIEPKGRDEAAKLMTDLKAMQESLVNIITRLQDSSRSMIGNVDDLVTEVTDLADHTETSSREIESSAAAMEQISTTARRSSENTNMASTVARQNADVAADGGNAMRDIVDTMNEIKESSARINEIIGTIDGIAFQTNLLALNASVEAARAGESGRGFAVVASEVGALAQRSADAARQVKTIVGDSVSQVDAGSRIVENACSTIENIVDTSRKVDQLLDEVNTATGEQSNGVDQLNHTLSTLESMSQMNVELVDRAAANTQSMRDGADCLASQVARFKLPAEKKVVS